MTLWKFTLREIRRRPGRAVLTLLSIAIGMGAVVSVSLGTQMARRAYEKMYETISGRSSLEVTAEGNALMDESLAASLQQVAGVEAAVPGIQRFTALYFASHKFTLLMMGIDPARDSQVREYALREGEFFPDGEGALLEAGFAEGIGARVGDEVKLLTPHGMPRGMKRIRVVGLLEPRGAAGFAKGGAVFLPLKLAQRWYTAPGKVTAISLVLDKSADEAVVAREIRKRLPPGLSVRPPAMRTQLSKATTLSIEQGLLLATTLVVALAIFIIVNTFLMNVSERRRQLAILRAVGATRPQIVRMLLAEGLVMGVLGTILGCLGGLAGGTGLMKAITMLHTGTPLPMAFTWWPFALAAVLGPVLTLAGAYIPAIMATKISPLEAMQPLVSQGRVRVPPLLTISGLAVLLVSLAAMIAAVRGWLPKQWSVFAATVFMADFVLLIPAMLGILARVVIWLLLPLLRLEARLAHRQVLRRPVRTALTIGVLYIAVMTGIGLGTMIINNVDDVKKWYQRTLIAGDFTVRVMLPGSQPGLTAEMPDWKQLRDELEHEVRGIESLDTIGFLNAQAAGHAIVVVAREFADKEALPLDLYQGWAEEVADALRRGEVVVGTVLAQRSGLKVGDFIEFQTKEGPKKARIAALAVDYLVGGYIVYMRRELASRLFRNDAVNAFAVRAVPDNQVPRAEVEAALRRFANERGLMLHSYAELNQMLDHVLAGVVGSLWGVLVLGFVVAAFGVANTLTMNVLEQTRELALLRVVAMTRRQVRKMILAQAAMIGLVGLGLGTIAGVVTAYSISASMMPLLGYPVDFILHGPLLVGCFLMGLLLVLAAAWLPAERAARLDLLIALQYE